MPVTKALRYEILRRDNHACRYCGATAPDVKLTVDHVMPVALGGKTAADNLVTACADCNAGKKATPPDAPLVEDVRQDALRWARAMRAGADIQRAVRHEIDEQCTDFMHWWLGHNDRDPIKDYDAAPLPADWKNSIKGFLEAGFDLDDLRHGVDIAFAAPVAPWSTWRYFCGVMWRTLGERQEIARGLLETGDAGGP